MKFGNVFTAVLLAGLLAFASGSALAAKADFLVDAGWLEQHINDPDLVLLEVRYYPHRYYTIGHIEGAIQVQRFSDLGDNSRLPIMFHPDHETFQETLRSWGINDDSTVVLYDDSVTALASRVYYMLDLFGFNMEQVKLLEGGTVEWTVFNDLVQEAPEVEPGNVTLEPADPALRVEWQEVYSDVVASRDPSITLLDARPEGQYSGEVVAGAPRGGHIPGAMNIVSLDGTHGETQTWKDMEGLEALYADLDPDKTIYAYCHDGFRSTLAYMQLKALGFEDVRVYDGGWSHWGRALSLPVVEGDAPYDADFEL
jgi:thiosulfate/3-mercaptopyruvate sulfurtransferase